MALCPVRLNVTGVPLATGPPVARSLTVADTFAEPPCAAEVAPVYAVVVQSWVVTSKVAADLADPALTRTAYEPRIPDFWRLSDGTGAVIVAAYAPPAPVVVEVDTRSPGLAGSRSVVTVTPTPDCWGLSAPDTVIGAPAHDVGALRLSVSVLVGEGVLWLDRLCVMSMPDEVMSRFRYARLASLGAQSAVPEKPSVGSLMLSWSTAVPLYVVAVSLAGALTGWVPLMGPLPEARPLAS